MKPTHPLAILTTLVLTTLAGCNESVVSEAEEDTAIASEHDGSATNETADAQDTQDTDDMPTPAVLDFELTSLTGQPVDLAKYQGQVVLIVNTASECGLTPQYEQLQQLHETYADQGLAILGFPANNFNGQEPGSDEEIAAFCEENFGVGFDMFAKLSVKGDDQHPLYHYLTSAETNPDYAGDITWNFEKFLISREGEVVARFAPRTRPDDPEVVAAIEAELANE
ncbi:MAG: glutathione peroxidase [Phycisphaerales bacterium JB063]